MVVMDVAQNEAYGNLFHHPGSIIFYPNLFLP